MIAKYIFLFGYALSFCFVGFGTGVFRDYSENISSLLVFDGWIVFYLIVTSLLIEFIRYCVNAPIQPGVLTTGLIFAWVSYCVHQYILANYLVLAIGWFVTNVMLIGWIYLYYLKVIEIYNKRRGDNYQQIYKELDLVNMLICAFSLLLVSNVLAIFQPLFVVYTAVSSYTFRDFLFSNWLNW